MRDNKNDSKHPPANEEQHSGAPAPDPLGHNEDGARRAETKRKEERQGAQQGAKEPSQRPAAPAEPHMQQTRLPGQPAPGQGATPAAAPVAQPEMANPAGPGVSIAGK
jgi:hypothetical protein